MKSVQEFLNEAKLTSTESKKAQKNLDKIMNSPSGNKLSVAWNDANEKEVVKILTKSGIKGNDQKAVMYLMFEDISED